MTKEEFIKEYCISSEVSREIFDKYFVALECRCGEETCKGWAAVTNDPQNIANHKSLYGEDDDVRPRPEQKTGSHL